MVSGRLWGARFGRQPSEEVIAFLSGRDVAGVRPCDEALVAADILGSRAHVVALFEQEIITKKDAQAILRALRQVERQHGQGKFSLDPSKEDVHTNVEAAVTQVCGAEHGGKIHTGRSRNDQVALDLRLHLRETALRSVEELLALADAFVSQGSQYSAQVIPGYTHHQHANFTTFGHLMMSYAHQTHRDIIRFKDWVGMFDRCPLGAAAGYGTSLGVDRERTAALLGFQGLHENSLDAITNRQEAESQFGFALHMVMSHLSSIAQTFLLLSTAEFGMLQVDDVYCTGSSIMPQKKNPDCLEIIKGKAAVTQGRLVALLSLGQGNFMGYNRESQLGKYMIMDMIADVLPSIGIMRGIVQALKVNPARMAELCAKGFLGATSLTEFLCAKKGLPFRRAKELVERAVRLAEKRGEEAVSFESLADAIKEARTPVEVTRSEVEAVQSPRSVLTDRLSLGSPSMAAMRRGTRFLGSRLQGHRTWLTETRARIGKALQKLDETERKLIG